MDGGDLGVAAPPPVSFRLRFAPVPSGLLRTYSPPNARDGERRSSRQDYLACLSQFVLLLVFAPLTMIVCSFLFGPSGFRGASKKRRFGGVVFDHVTPSVGG